ncbi:MAG: glycosyltransferase family 4 protein, partial [Gammaproteobacteria bacterium]
MKVWIPAIRAGTGADVHAELLAAGLSRRGIQSDLHWFSHYFELFPFLLRTVPAPPRTVITIANSWYGYGFKRKNIKLVITVYHCVHDESYAPYRSLRQKIYHDTCVYVNEYCSLQSADKVVAISNYTAASIKKIFKKYEPAVIYPGIDTAFFSPGRKTPDNGKFRLLFVGTASRRKGFDLLAPIMRRLGEGFTLAIATDAKPAMTAGVDNILALGRLSKDALVQAYRDCNALLFPTRFEGFGYAVCEAMACGKPVVTSDNSSLPELVKHNETGLLCKTNDVEAFVEAVKILASDPERTRSMGE